MSVNLAMSVLRAETEKFYLSNLKGAFPSIFEAYPNLNRESIFECVHG